MMVKNQTLYQYAKHQLNPLKHLDKILLKTYSYKILTFVDTNTDSHQHESECNPVHS